MTEQPWSNPPKYTSTSHGCTSETCPWTIHVFPSTWKATKFGITGGPEGATPGPGVACARAALGPPLNEPSANRRIASRRTGTAPVAQEIVVVKCQLRAQFLRIASL